MRLPEFLSLEYLACDETFVRAEAMSKMIATLTTGFTCRLLSGVERLIETPSAGQGTRNFARVTRLSHLVASACHFVPLGATAWPLAFSNHPESRQCGTKWHGRATSCHVGRESKGSCVRKVQTAAFSTVRTGEVAKHIDWLVSKGMDQNHQRRGVPPLGPSFFHTTPRGGAPATGERPLIPSAAKATAASDTHSAPGPNPLGVAGFGMVRIPAIMTADSG